MADLAEVIRSIPLFSALSREDVAKVLGRLEEALYRAGTTIFSQGDKGDAFYLIQSGAVQVVLEGDGRSEIVAVLGSQEWFGEMALLSGEPRSATIIAVKDTAVWRLSRAAWDDLIEKHPSWLLHFCATLSKRLSRLDQQYSHGRDAFNALAEEFYSARSPAEQEFFRRAALLTTIDLKIIGFLLNTDKAQEFLAALKNSQLPLIRPVNGGFELHGFFRDFLTEKLLAVEGPERKQRLHAQLATLYQALNTWQEAVHHCLEAGDWGGGARLLSAHKTDMIKSSASFLRTALYRIPPDYLFSDVSLVHLKVEILTHLGETREAIRSYKEFLARRSPALASAETVTRYEAMADDWTQKRNYTQALDCLRYAVSVLDQESAQMNTHASEFYGEEDALKPPPLLNGPEAAPNSAASHVSSLISGFYAKSSFSRLFGGVLGIAVWAYLWFLQPDIGLEPQATKLLGWLSLTLIYWVFWVFPDYGVALMFGLGLILSDLAKPDVVFGGFASTTWFMTLGVLGLGAAITGSGLFYRLSLQLVRFFPLNYYWQIVALGFMGIVVMALIPQQSARTAIISQMLVNLSDSLGYKNPSKASTGLFVASFLGLGQLGFLFLTGSTTSLIAYGLLPADVREQFTWGYWFLAALPPTLVVTAIILFSAIFLYQPESQAQVSYQMVQNQLNVLGPLARNEWITLGVLCFTVGGWLTISYHGIDGAWIALISLCVLINTGVLGWGMLKKGVDWELLIYMGATLSIPTLLTQVKIDEWLVSLISPLILPLLHSPALTFIVIVLITYAVKLVFTSFLTVVTLTVALLPLANDMDMSPWIVAMIILMASEVWFFPFQVDWHTLAYSTTEGKGFRYPDMYRINPFYALAYIVALLAAIPYWRFLGLMK
jgi:anion transporter